MCGVWWILCDWLEMNVPLLVTVGSSQEIYTRVLVKYKMKKFELVFVASRKKTQLCNTNILLNTVYVILKLRL